MKKLILYSIPFALFACNSSQESVQKEEEPEIIASLVIGDPLDCGIENKLMFPVGTSYTPNIHGEAEEYNINTDNEGYSQMNFSTNKSSAVSYDRFAETEYRNDNQEDFDITNILFYDLITGTSFPLIQNDTLHILSFAIHKEFENPLIFYRVVREDINNDEKYNALDPIMLFVSPLSGDTMIQVTPNNEQFIDYFYYQETQKILAKTRIDDNGDKVFNVADETNFIEMELNSPQIGNSIFPEDLKNALKGQLNL